LAHPTAELQPSGSMPSTGLDRFRSSGSGSAAIFIFTTV
jgi:hypothetical protein